MSKHKRQLTPLGWGVYILGRAIKHLLYIQSVLMMAQERRKKRNG
jgi:hypothetical protein